MNQSIILQLKSLIDEQKTYKAKKYDNQCETDDLVCMERYDDDVDYFFEQGFKIGLMLGIESKD